MFSHFTAGSNKKLTSEFNLVNSDAVTRKAAFKFVQPLLSRTGVM